MAELSSQDVVNSTRLVGEVSPPSAPGTTTQSQSNQGDEGEVGVITKENGLHITTQPSGRDEQALEDGTARSDTDTSRADGSVGDAKSTDARPIKKPAAAKPLSFAKYSVPKVVAANATRPTTEKGMLLLRVLHMFRFSNLASHSSGPECAILPSAAYRSPPPRRQNHQFSCPEGQAFSNRGPRSNAGLE